MSYEASFKMLVHLRELKTIYMTKVGYCAIRAELIDLGEQFPNHALPQLGQKCLKKQNKREGPAQCDEKSWTSSIMKIQYLDEVFQLNEIIKFTLNIPAKPNLKTNNIYLKFSLLFSGYGSYNGFLNEKHEVQHCNFKIKNIEYGIFHFSQGEFGGDFFSSFSFTCFCMNTHYFISQRMIINKKKEQSKTGYKFQNFQNSETFDLSQIIQKYTNIFQISIPGIEYFYETYEKNLRYFSQLLKIRVNELYKIKKKTKFYLPQFIKQKQITEKQFFCFFDSFETNKITIQQYQKQMNYLKIENERFSNQVAAGFSQNLFDMKKITEDFVQYNHQLKNLRIVKNISENSDDLFQAEKAASYLQNHKKVRKQKKFQYTFPLEKQINSHEIFLNYNVNRCKNNNKQNEQIILQMKQENMLIVICHGYLSSAADMRLIKLGIQQIFPHAYILVSKQNEVHTESDIDKMGQRLAQQIDCYVSIKKLNYQNYYLNFVGHSLGGIISRASLKYLKISKKKLGFYCSISSPHLGYLNGGLTKAGLWVMRNLFKKSCKSLQQLSMEDSPNPYQSFLFKLSQNGSLKDFRKIILISSAEDKYVPWHSARICQYKTKKKNSKIENCMIEKLTSGKTIHRVDINFGMPKNNIEAIIGRKAHLSFITQYEVFNLINSSIPKLFDISEQ